MHAMAVFSATSHSWDVVSVARRLKVQFPSWHVLPVLCCFPPGSPASSHGLQTVEVSLSDAWLRSSPVRDVTLPPPFDSWDGLQQTLGDAECRCWKCMDGSISQMTEIWSVWLATSAIAYLHILAVQRVRTHVPPPAPPSRWSARGTWPEKSETRETVSGTKMTRGRLSSRLDAFRRDFSRTVEAKYVNDETSSDAIRWRSFFINMTTLTARIILHILLDLINTQLHMFYT